MIDDSDGHVTMLAENLRKASKPHRCTECAGTIEAGEKYLCERYAWGGSAHTSKTCLHCCIVRRWLQAECGGWCFGAVEEDLREHAYSGYPMDVRRLAVGMQWQWRTPKGKRMPLPKMPRTTHERTALTANAK